MAPSLDALLLTLDGAVAATQQAIRAASAAGAVPKGEALRMDAWVTSGVAGIKADNPRIPATTHEGSAHATLAKEAAWAALDRSLSKLLDALDPVLNQTLACLPDMEDDPRLFIRLHLTEGSAFVQLRAKLRGGFLNDTNPTLWAWDSRAFHHAVHTVRNLAPCIGTGPRWILQARRGANHPIAPVCEIRAPNAEQALAWMAAIQFPALLDATTAPSTLSATLLRAEEGTTDLIQSLRATPRP